MPAGFRLAMPVEKSGQEEFDSSTARTSARTSRLFDPSFSKVWLFRYNHAMATRG
jgi:hypothetical protein